MSVSRRDPQRSFFDVSFLAEKFQQAGYDMLALIQWVRDQKDWSEHKQTELLRRVFAEQFEISGSVPVVRKVEASGTVQNPHDPQAQAAQEGRELIGPAMRSHNPHDGLVTTDQFDISTARRQAICPAGHVSTQCSRLENTDTGGVQYRFEWSYHCDACPLNSQCTTARRGRRAVLVGEHHDHLQARRRQMHTDAFREAMHQRNGIKGTISEFARNGGRRTRYRGLAKTALANYLHGAAINAKRWIRLLQYRMRPDCPMPI